LLSHFLLHCGCGLKVAQIARLVGIARPTASRQQGMSSKAAIHQAHHRMSGRAHGKLLPRYAGPIVAFLLRCPKASQAELIDFVAQTFDVHVSRIALYKFLKKYGLHDLSAPTQPPASIPPESDTATGPPRESPSATGVATSVAPALPPQSPPSSPPTPPVAPTPVVASVAPIAATEIVAPLPVIELASVLEPSGSSAPPFSSDGPNMPGPSC
jgi:hypothetical protein